MRSCSVLVFGLSLLTIQVSAGSPKLRRNNDNRRGGRVGRSILDNPLQRLVQQVKNLPSSLPCLSGVPDPDRTDNCCQRVYTPTGSQQPACCPADSVYSTTALEPSCCGPNEQTDIGGNCCGLTASGKPIDSYCSVGTSGCCPADKPNADGETCCSDADYTESSSTCCDGGVPAVYGTCCYGKVGSNLAGDQICCDDGQEPHQEVDGNLFCCAPADYDKLKNVCNDGNQYSWFDKRKVHSVEIVEQVVEAPSRKVMRRSVDEKPVQFKKTGASRHLLNKSQAVDMLANQGVFYYNDVLIYDPTFMPKRSRWSKTFDATVKTLSAWKPDVLADRASKLFRHSSGQIALSSNFKMNSSDGLYVVRELIDSPTFVSFDYSWITINKDGLEALANKLESQQNATMTAMKLRGREL